MTTPAGFSAPGHLGRRRFIKLAAAAGLLAGCSPAGEFTVAGTAALNAAPTGTSLLPSAAPSPTATPRPSRTPTPTLTPAPLARAQRPKAIQFYPDVPSKVVLARHAGVWTGPPSGGKGDNDLLAPAALRQMLDASIVELTGLGDARAAWSALFSPSERIAIKVNTLGFPGVAPFWTHVPLAIAVTECLQEAGVPAEQVFLYDITTSDLAGAGYPINRDGPGVQCYGTAESWDDRKSGGGRTFWESGAFLPGWTICGREVRLGGILVHCDALINMPRLSDHSLSGITFAMKNHYGSFDSAPAFHHHKTFCQAVVELNALSPIADRTRLVIGDLLLIAGWDNAVTGDSLLMSYDPVAADTVALQLWLDAWPSGSEGLTPETVAGRANPWLENAAQLGLGTNDLGNVRVVEVRLA